MKKIGLSLIVLGIFIFGIITVSAQASYCCEKTTDGFWCQNEDQENCNADFRMAPTHCDSTSYCKAGTCYDSQEGLCTEKTPQKVCEDNGGVWDPSQPEDLPQCQLGCCLIGAEAAFVTQVRCKKLSSLYGLETNFRTDLQDEFQCIASASDDKKGACVFEKEFEKTCQYITKKECSEVQDSTFHPDFLCSAETLATNCGPSEKTTCVDYKDQVYFVDTCGNIANIYDAMKIADKEYWTKPYGTLESCSPSVNNADSTTCGNCDYYLGSTCKSFDKTKDRTKPLYGDNICRDLSCSYEGQSYEHGETWCATSEGLDENLPGTRYIRLVCFNGDVTIEPCADYRQEVCKQDSINGFRTAACIVNKWQDCYSIDDEDDCEDQDLRDCEWVATMTKATQLGTCVPKYAPGFDHWNSEGDGEDICDLVDTTCTITCEKNQGDTDCESDLFCNLGDSNDVNPIWSDGMDKICSALGDCKGKISAVYDA